MNDTLTKEDMAAPGNIQRPDGNKPLITAETGWQAVQRARNLDIKDEGGVHRITVDGLQSELLLADDMIVFRRRSSDYNKVYELRISKGVTGQHEIVMTSLNDDGTTQNLIGNPQKLQAIALDNLLPTELRELERTGVLGAAVNFLSPNDSVTLAQMLDETPNDHFRPELQHLLEKLRHFTDITSRARELVGSMAGQLKEYQELDFGIRATLENAREMETLIREHWGLYQGLGKINWYSPKQENIWYWRSKSMPYPMGVLSELKKDHALRIGGDAVAGVYTLLEGQNPLIVFADNLEEVFGRIEKAEPITPEEIRKHPIFFKLTSSTSEEILSTTTIHSLRSIVSGACKQRALENHLDIRAMYLDMLEAHEYHHQYQAALRIRPRGGQSNDTHSLAHEVVAYMCEQVVADPPFIILNKLCGNVRLVSRLIQYANSNGVDWRDTKEFLNLDSSTKAGLLVAEFAATRLTGVSIFKNWENFKEVLAALTRFEISDEFKQEVKQLIEEYDNYKPEDKQDWLDRFLGY